MKDEITASIELSQDLLPEDRRKIIRQLILENGSVRTTALAEQMNVNPVTVRRDLRELEALDEVRLVHGGAVLAVPVQHVAIQNDLMSKRSTNIEEKIQIAKKAITLIKDGDTIAFNSGSTIELIVEHLPSDFKSLTVVALSLNVACMAAKHPYINLIVPGGILSRSSQALTGANAVNFISTLRVDKGFFGAQGADINAGFTESNFDQVATNRALIQVCSHKYLAADSSKFGNVAVGQICDLDEFNGLIVDDKVPDPIRSWAKATGVPLI
jgi:DeoR family fructose operon transcriptional repressor